MIYMRRKRSIVLQLFRPFLAVLLLVSIFGIVWLRSNLIATEYSLSELENKKMNMLRETKILMAERASLLSIKTVEKTAMTNLGLVFPDRRRVLYVDVRRTGPYNASMEVKEGAGR